MSTPLDETLACASDHRRVEIESVDRRGPKSVENELSPDSTTASDFECSPVVDRTAHSEQTARLESALDRRSHGVIHERVFDAID